MHKYIGLDVHTASTTAAVVDARGKRVGHHVIETNGQALIEWFKTQAGTTHVCLEEGTQAGWLFEILSPHVAEIVVTRVLESRGQKSDEQDAFALAEQLRAGTIATTVYKQAGSFATLRQLVKAHRMIVMETVRVQNRIKALFRARGVNVGGERFYSKAGREQRLRALPPSSRTAAAQQPSCCSSSTMRSWGRAIVPTRSSSPNPTSTR